MKKIAFLTALLIVAFIANAQKGQKQFNAGLGFAKDVIPVYVGFDFWVHEDISIGAEIGWRRENYNASNNTLSYYETTWNFSFNSNYHFSRILKIPNKFDPYAGLNIGLYYYDYDGYSSNTSGLGLGVQIGFRYYFTDKFAAGLEFSGGNRVSDGKIGVSLKF